MSGRRWRTLTGERWERRAAAAVDVSTMFSEEVRRAHASCGSESAAFLGFVARNLECLERAPFRVLDQKTAFIHYPLDSWPLFVGPAALGQMERASVGLSRLVQLVPRRIFDADERRLAEFYRLSEREALLATGLLQSGGDEMGLLSRGDFIFSAAGFQCLEFNFVSNLGGWQSVRWADAYLGMPLIARFLEEERIAASCRNTLRTLFVHVVERTLRRGGREVNLAFLLDKNDPGSALLREYAGKELHAVLEEMDRTPGQLVVATYDDLVERGGRLWCDGTRIDVVVEGRAGGISSAVFRCLMTGSIQVFNGPLAGILTTKRNLAALSEHQDSPRFSEEERTLIRQHVPWTRTVDRRSTLYAGETLPLPDLLLRERERFVLKEENSAGGKDVHLGRLTDPESWRSLVEKALTGGTWIVQEYVESLPFVNQRGERGSAIHDVVWGLFAFGDRYGGCFLRTLPRDAAGIVNAAQGARGCVAFEVGKGMS